MATQTNLKLYAATLFTVIANYFSIELPRDSPFDNPPSLIDGNIEEETRFKILDGYPLIVDKLNIKKDTEQSTMAQVEEVYQYIMLMDGGRWMAEITEKFGKVIRNIQL